MTVSPTAPPSKRLLFASYHCLLDTASGAAVSMRELLGALSQRRWQVSVLCGTSLDAAQGPSLEDMLAENWQPGSVRQVASEVAPFELLSGSIGAVPALVYRPADTVVPPPLALGAPFVILLEHLLDRLRPDVLVTYGGHWMGRAILACAKSRRIPVVFWLRNCSYQNAKFFADVQRLLVPSEATRRYYHQKLGLSCTAIASPINPEKILCSPGDQPCVTFINPQPAKGVFWFAGVTRELHRRRPDIPVLIVEGRGTTTWISAAGLTPNQTNLRVLPATRDPREFYRQTRILLTPSLWHETFARVAVEALFNGIPVLASTRGALPEVLGDAGFLFDIPPHYTEHTRLVPTSREVQPWVDTIIRLWDDQAFYQTHRQRCLAASQAYLPGPLIDRHEKTILDAISDSHSLTIPPRDHSDLSDLCKRLYDSAESRRLWAAIPSVLDQLVSS